MMGKKLGTVAVIYVACGLLTAAIVAAALGVVWLFTGEALWTGAVATVEAAELSDIPVLNGLTDVEMLANAKGLADSSAQDDLSTTVVTVKPGVSTEYRREVTFKIDDSATLTGAELAKNEAKKAFVTSGIPEALFRTRGEWGWYFVSASADKVQARVSILTLHGEEINLKQTTELSADGRWLTSYEEGEWNTTPVSVIERIEPSK